MLVHKVFLPCLFCVTLYGEAQERVLQVGACWVYVHGKETACNVNADGGELKTYYPTALVPLRFSISLSKASCVPT